jgi:hypothetical protein
VSKIPSITVPKISNSSLKHILLRHGISKGILHTLFNQSNYDIELIDSEVNRNNFEKTFLENFIVETTRIKKTEEESIANVHILEVVCRNR